MYCTDMQLLLIYINNINLIMIIPQLSLYQSLTLSMDTPMHTYTYTYT